jgi:hypothetical protein
MTPFHGRWSAFFSAPSTPSSTRPRYAEQSPEERAPDLEQERLTMSVPELRSRALDQLTATIYMLTEEIARRVGRGPANFAALLDAGLEQLETGLPV